MTDDTEIPVDAVDDVDGEQDELDPEAELDDFRESFERAVEGITDLDPDDVAFIGAVVIGNERYEDPDGEPSRGFTVRLINPDMEQFEDIRHVFAAIESYNRQVDRELPIDLDGEPSGPAGAMSLADLMGG